MRGLARERAVRGLAREVGQCEGGGQRQQEAGACHGEHARCRRRRRTAPARAPRSQPRERAELRAPKRGGLWGPCRPAAGFQRAGRKPCTPPQREKRLGPQSPPLVGTLLGSLWARTQALDGAGRRLRLHRRAHSQASPRLLLPLADTRARPTSRAARARPPPSCPSAPDLRGKGGERVGRSVFGWFLVGFGAGCLWFVKIFCYFCTDFSTLCFT